MFSVSCCVYVVVVVVECMCCVLCLCLLSHVVCVLFESVCSACDVRLCVLIAALFVFVFLCVNAPIVFALHVDKTFYLSVGIYVLIGYVAVRFVGSICMFCFCVVSCVV